VNELHLFAGAGGGILGGILLGHTCVCAVEIEPYCRKVLLQRQRDKILPPFPIWDDVQTFDGKPWRGKVDIVCGGFPCQDISSAGKGAGITEGTRSGLWFEMRRIIGEIRPDYCFIENSPMLAIRGGVRVIADLAELGFNAKWGIVSAENAGAFHKRERFWILAYSNKIRSHGASKDSYKHGKKRSKASLSQSGERSVFKDRESYFSIDFGNDDGLADRLDRLKAIGNGQVPAVVELAWKTLAGG
jgi:DNA (cytosine-5)-methyltransferase 1